MSEQSGETTAEYVLSIPTNILIGHKYLLFANIMRQKCRKGVTPTNPRGIPSAPFVDKVEDYVSSRQEVEATLRGNSREFGRFLRGHEHLTVMVHVCAALENSVTFVYIVYDDA